MELVGRLHPIPHFKKSIVVLDVMFKNFSKFCSDHLNDFLSVIFDFGFFEFDSDEFLQSILLFVLSFIEFRLFINENLLDGVDEIG